ncbi:MAG: 4-hydroxy-3-methylbut-2-enyl diphosphate reductase, partial [Bacteroidota bacterium]
MKQFQVPSHFRSNLLSAVKQYRKQGDKMKKDFSPTLIDLGTVRFYLARHFGFCYGVENAIEIAIRTIEENPGKRIFLLSEMIHNPQVNAGLLERGVKFLQDTYGNQLIPFDDLKEDDVVIIPAFGTTLETEKLLRDKGIAIEKYNTTCPFVEKVWNRGEQIAAKGYTIVIHGKPAHEETRATFSHAGANAPSVVVNDLKEAELLADFIRGIRSEEEFYTLFKGRHSVGFNPVKDLQRMGVINQTTQLASDTQEITDYLKQTVKEYFSLNEETLPQHFADTRDTLCYATNDNQTAVKGLLEQKADLTIVVGGYNSSNTTHLVELCEKVLPTYFINGADQHLSPDEIMHYNFHDKKEYLTRDYLPQNKPVSILIT